MKRSTSGLLMIFASVAAMVGAEASRPNIAIVFNDDQGYQDLGYYGNPYSNDMYPASTMKYADDCLFLEGQAADFDPLKKQKNLPI